MNDDNLHGPHDVGPEFDQDNVLPDESDTDNEEVLSQDDIVTEEPADDVDDLDLNTSAFDDHGAADTDDVTEPRKPAAKKWPLPKILVFAAAAGIFAWVAWSTLFGDTESTPQATQPVAHIGGALQGQAPSHAPLSGGADAPSVPLEATETSNGSMHASTKFAGQDDLADPSNTADEPAPAMSAAMVAKVATLDDAVSDLKVQMTAIQEQLKKLASETRKHTAPAPRRQVAKAAPKPKATKTSKTTHSASKAGKLAQGGPTLKAVLTGQAWFQLASGTTITVGVGGDVPEYGRVKAIDANAGTVRFTNGLVAK